MFKLLLKIGSVCFVIFIVLGFATIVKGNGDQVSEVSFMSLFLGSLIALLVIIRRNKSIRQFIYDRKKSSR